jgi:hypothetical protein
MKNSLLNYFRFSSLIVLGLLFLTSPLYAASSNVAIIDSAVGAATGSGTFPTTTGAFAGFTFTAMPVANVNAANLAAFDTVLLNMASTGMNCDSGNLSAGQKTDLVNFVNGGGKLLIWDPECPIGVNYSWLPFPFTTSNPGGTGSTGGTLIINANNDLASSLVASPKFIDAAMVASGTDAVGDMNVMVTKDPDWCLSMSGTNANNATGPVQAYAISGSGLIIYNGMDTDFISATSDTTTPGGNLAKIWLQQLQVTSLPSSCVQVVQKATTVPTMTEWGMIIFMMLAGLGSVYYLRRQRKES